MRDLQGDDYLAHRSSELAYFCQLILREGMEAPPNLFHSWTYVAIR